MAEEGKTAEEIVEGLRPWLRDGYRQAFESALAWGWPRCRTEEERVMYPLLLVALSPYSAVVAPRRMPEGGIVSFQVSLSRNASEGSQRHQWSVISGEILDEEKELDLSIRFSCELVREQPLRAVAQVVEDIQKHLLEIQ